MATLDNTWSFIAGRSHPQYRTITRSRAKQEGKSLYFEKKKKGGLQEGRHFHSREALSSQNITVRISWEVLENIKWLENIKCSDPCRNPLMETIESGRSLNICYQSTRYHNRQSELKKMIKWTTCYRFTHFRDYWCQILTNAEKHYYEYKKTKAKEIIQFCHDMGWQAGGWSGKLKISTLVAPGKG